MGNIWLYKSNLHSLTVLCSINLKAGNRSTNLISELFSEINQLRFVENTSNYLVLPDQIMPHFLVVLQISSA